MNTALVASIMAIHTTSKGIKKFNENKQQTAEISYRKNINNKHNKKSKLQQEMEYYANQGLDDYDIVYR